MPGPVDPQLLAAVTAWCADKGVLAEDLRVQRRSLEDVFLDLTGHGPAMSRRGDGSPGARRAARAAPAGATR